MTNLRLFTAAGMCVVLWWPVGRATSPTRVPWWADQVLYFADVDRFADGDSRNNVNVDREPLPSAWADRQVRDAWRDTTAVARDGLLAAALPARGAAIFVTRSVER